MRVQRIGGTMVSDVLVSVLLCPFAAVQLYDEACAALRDGTSNFHISRSRGDNAARDALHRTVDTRGSPDAAKAASLPSPLPQVPQVVQVPPVPPGPPVQYFVHPPRQLPQRQFAPVAEMEAVVMPAAQVHAVVAQQQPRPGAVLPPPAMPAYTHYYFPNNGNTH